MELELTEAQMTLLRGLVANAANTENERVERMKARPAGSHSPASLAAAMSVRDDLAGLEAAVEAAYEVAVA